ncbi:MAG TPA: DUF5399 family protein [Chlamydiales bacterium]|jgi:hypothetical protein|nr:DUF5399 family protein [Chlamydiales bacterium]
MSIKPRTIDNLGMESSVRYAKDKEQLDLRLVEDSKWISKRIEISVTKPYVPSEFEKLFSAKPTLQWALFSAPPAYEAHTQALFSYQLIPSLGSNEKQEADAEKLIALEESLKKERRPSKDGEEQQEEERKRKRLLAFFKCLEKLDQTLTFINARRNQYQRG